MPEDSRHLVLAPPGHFPWEHLLGDFDPPEFEPPTTLLDAAKRALEQVLPAAKTLGLQGTVRIFFTDLSDQDHVGRYMNGTSSSPIIALGLEPFWFGGRRGLDPEPELRLTLLHELGHAFLDSRVASTHDQAEEDVVEHFAQTGDYEALERYAQDNEDG